MKLASIVLKYSAAVALLVLAAGIVISTEALWQLKVATESTELKISDSFVQVPGILDRQLRETNKSVNRAVVSLSSSTVAVQRDVHSTLAGLETTTSQLNRNLADLDAVENSVNKVVANSNIPALLRDTRQTVALTGSTMAHVRSTANTVAEAAPKISESVQSVSASVAGIAKDVNKVTDDFVKPQPWWKKALGYLGDAVKIGGTVF